MHFVQQRLSKKLETLKIYLKLETIRSRVVDLSFIVIFYAKTSMEYVLII